MNESTFQTFFRRYGLLAIMAGVGTLLFMAIFAVVIDLPAAVLRPAGYSLMAIGFVLVVGSLLAAIGTNVFKAAAVIGIGGNVLFYGSTLLFTHAAGVTSNFSLETFVVTPFSMVGMVIGSVIAVMFLLIGAFESRDRVVGFVREAMPVAEPANAKVITLVPLPRTGTDRLADAFGGVQPDVLTFGGPRRARADAMAA